MVIFSEMFSRKDSNHPQGDKHGINASFLLLMYDLTVRSFPSTASPAGLWKEIRP